MCVWCVSISVCPYLSICLSTDDYKNRGLASIELWNFLPSIKL